ncbi:MAG: SDR family NAD(P)-dependent oxidoreductase [Myxococcota bacterium]
MMTSTSVITGGTAGIGLQTATTLAQQGWRVVVTGRDARRGAEAVAEIRRQSGHEEVHFAPGDLASASETLALAADLQRRFPRIDVLINNAGVLADDRRTTEDGVELHFAVNVVAPYRLTLALLPSLEAAGSARVVNVTGGAPIGGVDLGDLQAERGYRGLGTYSHSKRAMEAMSLALAPRLAERGVLLNIVHPGGASTPMTRAMTRSMLPWWMRPLWPLFSRQMTDDGVKSAAKASRSSVWAATTAKLEGVAGGSFNTKCRPFRLHRTVQDPQVQQQVLAAVQAAARSGAGSGPSPSESRHAHAMDTWSGEDR